VILSTHQLCHRFGDGSLLQFPDLAVNAGERVLIMGASGCGKSTLLNLISGVLPLSYGEIELLDTKYSQASSRTLDQLRADHMGVIFQTLNLIPYLSGHANASLGLRFSRLRNRRLESVDPEINRLAKALGLVPSILERSANQLSIGQQQRIAVIRALLGKPELILADEPTSALDPEATQEFMRELMGSFDATRQAMIVVSHNPELTTFFDTVITLEGNA
jgi:putative ABC transport system ATP-binding protein